MRGGGGEEAPANPANLFISFLLPAPMDDAARVDAALRVLLEGVVAEDEKSRLLVALEARLAARPRRSWSALPPRLLLAILAATRCARTTARASAVCTTWRKITASDNADRQLWRSLARETFRLDRATLPPGVAPGGPLCIRDGSWRSAFVARHVASARWRRIGRGDGIEVKKAHCATGCTRGVTAVLLAGDAGIVLGTGAGDVQVWMQDAEKTGDDAWTLARTWHGHSGAVLALCIPPADRAAPGSGVPLERLVSAGNDGRVLVWSWAGGSGPVARLEGHRTGGVTALTVAPLPLPPLLLSGGSDGIRVWSLTAMSLSFVIEGAHKRKITRLAVLPPARHGAGGDGGCMRLVSSSLDATVKVWAVEGTGGRLLATLDHTSSSSGVIGFETDGERLVSASTNCQIHLWSLLTHTVLLTVPLAATCLSLASTHLLLGTMGGEVVVAELATGNVLTRVPVARRSLAAIDAAGGGSRLVVGGVDGTAVVLDVN